MEARSKYFPALRAFLDRPVFTAGDALKAGIPRHALAYFEKIGVIERVKKGVYRSSTYESQVDITQEGLAVAAYTTPNAVICLISALELYNLTDEIPRKYWLAIPQAQRAPSSGQIRAVRMRNMSLGVTTISLGEYELTIFDPERCIVDAFRYLSIEIAVNALKTYFHSKEYRPDLDKLRLYAKNLRVNLKPYILTITT